MAKRFAQGLQSIEAWGRRSVIFVDIARSLADYLSSWSVIEGMSHSAHSLAHNVVFKI